MMISIFKLGELNNLEASKQIIFLIAAKEILIER